MDGDDFNMSFNENLYMKELTDELCVLLRTATIIPKEVVPEVFTRKRMNWKWYRQIRRF